MANGKYPWCEYHTSPYLSIVQARVMKGNDLALGVMRTKRCGAGPRDRTGLQSCGTRWRQGEGNRSERVVGLGVCHVFQDAVGAHPNIRNSYRQYHILRSGGPDVRYLIY